MRRVCVDVGGGGWWVVGGGLAGWAGLGLHDSGNRQTGPDGIQNQGLGKGPHAFCHAHSLVAIGEINSGFWLDSH